MVHRYEAGRRDFLRIMYPFQICLVSWRQTIESVIKNAPIWTFICSFCPLERHFAGAAKQFQKWFMKGSCVKVTNFPRSLTPQMDVFLFLTCSLPEDKDCLSLHSYSPNPAVQWEAKSRDLFSAACILLGFLSLLFVKRTAKLELLAKHGIFFFAHVNPDNPGVF